jgi:uncharacterized membrane protein (DUF106 family)
MEHPLIPNLDNLKLEELGEKITELNRKLRIAQNTGNGNLCNQIRMALESYQNKHSQLLQETFNATNLGKNLDDKIDIR